MGKRKEIFVCKNYRKSLIYKNKFVLKKLRSVKKKGKILCKCLVVLSIFYV